MMVFVEEKFFLLDYFLKELSSFWDFILWEFFLLKISQNMTEILLRFEKKKITWKERNWALQMIFKWRWLLWISLISSFFLFEKLKKTWKKIFSFIMHQVFHEIFEKFSGHYLSSLVLVSEKNLEIGKNHSIFLPRKSILFFLHNLPDCILSFTKNPVFLPWRKDARSGHLWQRHHIQFLFIINFRYSLIRCCQKITLLDLMFDSFCFMCKADTTKFFWSLRFFSLQKNLDKSWGQNRSWQTIKPLYLYKNGKAF